MIPLGDDVPVRRRPWVNYALIATNVAVFLFMVSRGPRAEAFVGAWAVLPSELLRWWAAGHSPGAHAPLTLVTYAFLHAGWLHLLGNMLFLWIFGDNVEDRFGHLGYLSFYLLGAVVSGVVQALAVLPSAVPLVGASGAIAAVLGAFLLLYPTARVSLLLVIVVFVTVIRVPASLVLGVWFLFQLLHGVAALGPAVAGDNVGWWAHIAGFLIGVGLTPLWPKTPAGSSSAGVPASRFGSAFGAGGFGRSPAATPAVRWVGWVFGAIQWLLLARVALVLLHFVAPPLARVALELVSVASDPLVAPFAARIHPLLFGPWVLDLAAVVALVSYRLIEVVVVWLLSTGLRPRRARA